MEKIYKCDHCDAMVEVVQNVPVALTCCDNVMVVLDEKFTEVEGNEKHVPVIDGKTVKVGSVPHPMQAEHSIEWVEASDGQKTQRVVLHPTDEPIADFDFEPTSARAYCNVHGLWKSA